MKKNEVVIIKNRGGKVLEIKIICHQTKKNMRFSTDNVVEGAMEIKPIPAKWDDLLTWMDRNGRLHELEKFIYDIMK